jgi:AcrR family transcriptional regulator
MPAAKMAARQHILETAGRLFFREGYRAVGIDTIVAASGVAKMTLYRHFPSKDELIVAYLETMNERFWSWFEGAIADQPTPRAQLTALFTALAKLVSSPHCYGCPFLNAAGEFPELDHPGHRTALAHKQAVRARLLTLTTAAHAPEPAILADQLAVLMDGAYLQVRMFGTDNPAKWVAEAAETLIAQQLDA